MKSFVVLSVFHGCCVDLLQVSGFISFPEEEDHPEDPDSGCGASVRHASHRPAGGERGRHRETAGRLPEGPQAGLLPRCLTEDTPLISPSSGDYVAFELKW